MPKFVVTGRSMEVEAESEEEAVNRAQDASGWHWEAEEVKPERQFEARGSVTIEYAMGFSETEAREWFPGAQWDDEGASQAGWIEDLVASGEAPGEFWECVRIKRDMVFDSEKLQRDETISVGEL